MKRSYDDRDSKLQPPKRPRDGTTRDITMPCVLKFLTPAPLASAIIGKGGSTIAAMRQSTQAQLGLTDKGQHFPGTDSRILTAQANTEDSLNEVCRLIIAKAAECAEQTPSEDLGHPGDVRLRSLVPRIAVGGIIGKGGRLIKSLRESTGCKISISDATEPGPGAEQVVLVSGAQETMQTVFMEINKQVQMLNTEAWFGSWASNSGAVAGGGGGLMPIQPGRGGGMGPPVLPLPNLFYGGAPAAAPAPNISYGGGGGGGGGGNHGLPPAVYQGGGGGPPGIGGGATGSSHAGIEMLMNVASDLPAYVMEDTRGFALSCVVPNSLVGGLIGRGGAGTKEVQNITGTKIGIREVPGDSENRSLNISGPLANTCAAYMLMMKRYLDSEAQGPSPAAAAAPPVESDGKGRGRRR